LPKYGFAPLTPRDSLAGYRVYSLEGGRSRFQQALKDAKVFVTLSRDRIRVPVSIYNDADDIERLIRVLTA
jgi:selenocysteine lyase/cysteine desulfurase